MTTEIDDLRLVWPASVFVAEAEDLLSTGYADEDVAVRLLFEEAFAGSVGSRLIDEVCGSGVIYRGKWKPGMGQVLVLGQSTSHLLARLSPQHLPPRRLSRSLLEDVAAMAARGEVKDYEATAYWSTRRSRGGQQVHVEPARLTHLELCRHFMELLQELENAEYLQPVGPYDCQEESGVRSEVGSTLLSRLLGRRTEWPLDSVDAALEPDELFDLIEVFFDLVARPRTEQWHHCRDFHYYEHDRRAGQRVYRWKVNALLERSDVLLRISGAAADAGRLVEISGDARDELEPAALQRADAGPPGRRVAHAVVLHRGRQATTEDKRDAVKALGDALENQRDEIRTLLGKPTESDLFGFLNRFQIRHFNRFQSGEYGEEFLDYFYWTFLATEELMARLRAREPAGRAMLAEPGLEVEWS